MKLIIDCDPGHDDAVAIIFAHVHATVLGITTVSGNAPLESTTRNALAVLELINADTPVHSGAAA
ncbi:MAG: nucleoside hydrolase, partial [Gammaproteobacteria bacterium]|nr:nucleoside hydrolase [Gammaproteobacteria bacterium]